MNLSNFSRCVLMVSSDGGDVSAVDGDGILRWECGLVPGIHKAEQFLPFVLPTDTLHFSDTVTPIYRRERVSPSSYGPGALDTGANVNFRPTRATAAEVAMRKMLQSLSQRADLADKRLAAAESLVRLKKAESHDESSGLKGAGAPQKVAPSPDDLEAPIETGLAE
jgi:hypothetical protein